MKDDQSIDKRLLLAEIGNRISRLDKLISALSGNEKLNRHSLAVQARRQQYCELQENLCAEVIQESLDTNRMLRDKAESEPSEPTQKRNTVCEMVFEKLNGHPVMPRDILYILADEHPQNDRINSNAVAAACHRLTKSGHAKRIDAGYIRAVAVVLAMLFMVGCGSMPRKQNVASLMPPVPASRPVSAVAYTQPPAPTTMTVGWKPNYIEPNPYKYRQELTVLEVAGNLNGKWLAVWSGHTNQATIPILYDPQFVRAGNIWTNTP